MNYQISRLATIVVLASITLPCNADSYVGHVSKIDGVSLLWLHLTKDGTPHDLLTDEEEAKFVSHCNGKNKIFIYELGSKGFICKIREDNRVREPWEKPSFIIEIHGIQNEDIASAPHLYQGTQGIYTISKTKLPQKMWQVETLPEKTIAQLLKMMKNKSGCENHQDDSLCQKSVGTEFVYSTEHKTTIVKSKCKNSEVDFLCQLFNGNEFNYAEYKELITKTESPYGDMPNDIKNLAVKIRGTAVEVLLVPVNVVEGPEASTHFVTAVFSMSATTYKYIGQFPGSLVRVGADIDGDGLPELIIDNSRAGLSQRIDYYKVFPVVDVLMSYHHS